MNSMPMNDFSLLLLLCIIWPVSTIYLNFIILEDTEEIINYLVIVHYCTSVTFILYFCGLLLKFLNMRGRHRRQSKPINELSHKSRTVLIMACTHICTHVPFIIVCALRVRNYVVDESFIVTYYLVLVNTVVNPLVIWYRTPFLSCYIHQMFRLKRSGTKRSQSSTGTTKITLEMLEL